MSQCAHRRDAPLYHDRFVGDVIDDVPVEGLGPPSGLSLGSAHRRRDQRSPGCPDRRLWLVVAAKACRSDQRSRCAYSCPWLKARSTRRSDSPQPPGRPCRVTHRPAEPDPTTTRRTSSPSTREFGADVAISASIAAVYVGKRCCGSSPTYVLTAAGRAPRGWRWRERVRS